MTLTDKKIEAIKVLYSNDEKFRASIDAALIAEANRLRAQANLFAESADIKPTTKKSGNKRGGHVPGSKNHKSYILEVIKANGKISIGDIRQALSDMDHDITDKTLSQYLHDMKKKSVIKAEGDYGHSLYSVA